MKALTEVTDPTYIKPTKFSATDLFFLKFIRDERDLPFIYLILKITFSLIPAGIFLFVAQFNTISWWIAAIIYTLLNNVVFKGPFGLMLHCTSHRALFKKKYNYLNYYLPWIIAPFFGHSPETYFTHHIGMHHAENNLEADESSTMPFQRDSFADFLKYFGIFLFSGMYHLASYFKRKNRKKLLYKTVRGEFVFVIFCLALCFINFYATLVVFIIPFFLFRLVAMIGNWAQHAFICADDPANNYKNSITCINTKYNLKCWNDGYHISHHEKQNMHWTEHPDYFNKTLDNYIFNKAIVFDGIHFLHVYLYLMLKRYDLLAKHFVNIGEQFKTEDEIILFLKSRTRKIDLV